MDECALPGHVSCVPEVPEDSSQAFHTIHYIFRTAKPIAMTNLGSLPIRMPRVRTRDTQSRRPRKSTFWKGFIFRASTVQLKVVFEEMFRSAGQI
jgi:hypothetical protein